MTDAALQTGTEHHPLHHSRQPAWTQKATSFGVFAVLAVGTIYAATALMGDLRSMSHPESALVYVLLFVALAIALDKRQADRQLMKS